MLTLCRATYSLGVFEDVLAAISEGELNDDLISMVTDNQAGRMQPKGMITKTIKLDEVVAEGFQTLIEDKENHVKILVDVGAGI